MQTVRIANRAGQICPLLNFITGHRLLLLALPLFVATVSGAEDKPARSISVSGTVETKVAPDQVVWQITLTAADPVLAKAKERSDEQAKAVLGLQQKLAIAKGDLQTGMISVSRDYEHSLRGERGNFKQFIVNRSVTIRERDMNRFDEYLNTLLASTDMEVYFSFESSRLQDIRADARLKALRAAKDKAAAMAEALGAKLGRVATISEHTNVEPWRSPLANNIKVDQGPSTADVSTDTFAPGSISVPVTVDVTFELE